MSRLNTKHISIANPYNDKHIMMFNEFEQGNNIVNTTSEYLKDTRRNLSEDEYNKECKESNEIKQSLFITNKNEIIDSCHIQGEKDIRTCTLFFAPIKTLKKRPIIEQTMDYAFSILGMKKFLCQQHQKKKVFKQI